MYLILSEDHFGFIKHNMFLIEIKLNYFCILRLKKSFKHVSAIHVYIYLFGSLSYHHIIIIIQHIRSNWYIHNNNSCQYDPQNTFLRIINVIIYVY